MSVHKSFRMHPVGVEQDVLALLEHMLGTTIMHIGRGQQLNAAMMVKIVVPIEELPAPASGIRQTAKALGIIRAVLQGFELGFRIGIVIGNIGS